MVLINDLQIVYVNLKVDHLANLKVDHPGGKIGTCRVPV